MPADKIKPLRKGINRIKKNIVSEINHFDFLFFFFLIFISIIGFLAIVLFSFSLNNNDSSGAINSLTCIPITLAVVISYLTLNEMREQRKSAYQPHLLIKSPMPFSLCWRHFHFSAFKYIHSKEPNIRSEENERNLILLAFNTGLGSINSVQISYEFDLDTLLRDFPKDCVFSLEEQTGYLHYQHKEDSSKSFNHLFCTSNEGGKIDAILPINVISDPTIIIVPSSFSFLVAALSFICLENPNTKNLFECIPPLISKFKYSDIGGETVIKEFKWKIRPIIFTNNDNKMELYGYLELVNE